MILPVVLCGCEIRSLTYIKETYIGVVTEHGAEKNTGPGRGGGRKAK
jgi:hypothetical protein